jgi:predicted nuclease with RNAse H fold
MGLHLYTLIPIPQSCAKDESSQPKRLRLTVPEQSRKVRGNQPRPTERVRRGDFERFLGIDLGGGKGKKTALAVLEASGDSIAVVALMPRKGEAPLYDATLVEAIKSRGDRALVCVDAPLTLPPCLRCQVPVCPGQDRCVDPAVVEMQRLAGTPEEPTRDHRRGKPNVTPYTQRATEVYLHRKRGVLPRETLGQGMGPLTARAAHLLRALADSFQLNRNIIEVYPKATLALLDLGEPYKKRAEARLRILSRIPELTFAPGVWREECVQSDHAFDAIVCAYTGYLFARDGWTMPPESAAALARDGWIWAPPERAGRTQVELEAKRPDALHAKLKSNV